MAIDLLNLTPHKVSRDLTGYITYIYGPEKIGKTTFCAKMKNCLILATERGYNALDGVYAVDITSWSDIRAVLRELKKPEVKQRFSSVAVDTVDYAAEYCTKYICNQNGISDLSELGYGKGYALMRKEFSDVFNTLIKLGYAVVFVSHSQESTFTRPDGTEYNKIVPSLSPAKVNAIVANMADLYGYAHIVKDDKGVNHRVLTLRAPDDSVACGCRFANIEANVPFSYDAVAKALHDAIDKMENTTDEPIKPVESDLPPIGEVIDRFNEIQEALQKNTSKEEFKTKWVPFIKKLISDNLGKGVRITEAPQEKVEQAMTVVEKLEEAVGEGI